jgi:hypothetical protein
MTAAAWADWAAAITLAPLAVALGAAIGITVDAALTLQDLAKRRR